MSQIVPPLNTYGAFSVLPPYTIESGNYRCASLQLISVLVANGVDVFNTYYASVGLDNTIYTEDLDNDVSIVTLIPDIGDSYSIPSSYISNVPIELAVPYSQIVLSVDLGELPDQLSLSGLLVELQQLVQDYVGVVPKPKLHKITALSNYSVTQHNAKELIRLASIADTVSFYTAKRALTLELDAAKVRITDLENALIALS